MDERDFDKIENAEAPKDMPLSDTEALPDDGEAESAEINPQTKPDIQTDENTQAAFEEPEAILNQQNDGNCAENAENSDTVALENTEIASPVKKNPHKKAAAAIIAVLAVMALIVSSLLYCGVFSARARFINLLSKEACDFISLFGDLSELSDMSLIQSAANSVELSGTAENKDGGAADFIIKKDENGASADFSSDSSPIVSVYLDADNAAASFEGGEYYSLNIKNAVNNGNEAAKEYASAFEKSDGDPSAAKELKKILSDCVGYKSFIYCDAALDGKTFDALRLNADEAAAPQILTDIISEILASDNESLKNSAADIFSSVFGIKEGEDASETLENALKTVRESDTKFIITLCKGVGGVAAISADIKIGDFSAAAVYKNIRNGKNSETSVDITVVPPVSEEGEITLKFTSSGTVKYTDGGFESIGEASFTKASDGDETVMSGEYSASAASGRLSSFGVTLSSSDKNDSLGLSLSCGEDFSVSVSFLTGGYGQSAVISATDLSEKNKIDIRDIKLVIREACSQSLLDAYGISEGELGVKSYGGAFSAEKKGSKTDIRLELTQESSSVSVDLELENPDNIFKRLFKKVFSAASRTDISGKIKITTSESETVYTVDAELREGSGISVQKPEKFSEIASEDGTANGEVYGAFREKMDALRNNSSAADTIWQKIVRNFLENITNGGVDTGDYNSAEFSYNDFLTVEVGKSTVKEIESALGVQAVKEKKDTPYTYCYFYSPDFDADTSKGKLMQLVEDENGIIIYKFYSDYDSFDYGDLPVAQFARIKIGMSRDEMLSAMNGKTPIMQEAMLTDGVLNETYYYGTDENYRLDLLVSLTDGVVTKIP